MKVRYFDVSTGTSQVEDELPAQYGRGMRTKSERRRRYARMGQSHVPRREECHQPS